MSPVTHLQRITWWKFVNGPKRALQLVSATEEPLAIVLKHGADPEFPGNDEGNVTTHVILTKAAYDALVEGQNS